MHSQSMRARSQFIFRNDERRARTPWEAETAVIIVIEMKANKFIRTTRVFAYT